MTGRRPIVESVFANAADATDGCTVRRGSAVKALRIDGARVDAVVLEDGEVVEADVVVDAGGRRSPFGDLIEQAGLRRPVEDRHDFGFVYYTCHFRSADGSMPPALGPLLQAYESLSIGTLPADNGHWAIIVVTSGRVPVPPGRCVTPRTCGSGARPQLPARRALARWRTDRGCRPDHRRDRGPLPPLLRRRCTGRTRGAPARRRVRVHQPVGRARHLYRLDARRGAARHAARARRHRCARPLARVGRAAPRPRWGRTCATPCSSTVTGSPRSTRRSPACRTSPTIRRGSSQQRLFGHSGEDPELLRGVIDIMSLLDRAPQVLARARRRGPARRVVEGAAARATAGHYSSRPRFVPGRG